MKRIRSIRATALVPVAVAALVAGCASTEVIFDKPGVTQAEKEQEQGVCLRQSIGTNGRNEILVPYTIDREAFNKCMEARGYTVKSM